MGWRICLVTSDPKAWNTSKCFCEFSNLSTCMLWMLFLFFNLVYRVILIQELFPPLSLLLGSVWSPASWAGPSYLWNQMVLCSPVGLRCEREKENGIEILLFQIFNFFLPLVRMGGQNMQGLNSVFHFICYWPQYIHITIHLVIQETFIESLFWAE